VFIGAIEIASVILTEVVGRFVDENWQVTAGLLGKGIELSYFLV